MTDDQARHALTEALRLAEHGYHLTPVIITRATDGKKKFRFAHGWATDTAATADPAQIRAWWVDQPDTSFAVINRLTGTEQADLDVKDDRNGVAWWNNHNLPEGGLVVLTPTGGIHHYWRARDDGRTLGNDSNPATGVDTRNANGLVIAPGGYVVGEEGVYELATPLVKPEELPQVPDSVLNALPAAEKAREYRTDGAITYKTEDWLRERANAQLDRVEQWRPGAGLPGFRATLMGAAMFIAKIVDAGLADEQEAIAHLTRAVRQVWGEPDLNDLMWIRQGWQDALTKERFRVGAEPGGTKLNTPGLEQAPTDQQLTTTSDDDEPKLPNWALLPVTTEWAHYKEAAKRAGAKLADLDEAGPTKAPDVFLLADLLAEEDEDDTYRIEGLWSSDGKCTLIAPSKAGKTTLVGNLLRSLADGVPFLGTNGQGFQTHPILDGKIVLLDFEMTRRKLRAWLRRQHIAHPERIGLEMMRGQTWDIRDPEVRAVWAEHLRERNTKILVIDPLGPILHGLGIEENDNTQVGRFLTHIDVLCREAGIPEYLVVHHTGHDGTRGRGASSLRGWPDSEWMLLLEDAQNGKLPDQDTARFFRAAGRDVSVRETALTFDPEHGVLAMASGTRATVAVDKHGLPIVELVGEQPGLGHRKLAGLVTDRLGIGRSTADHLIRSLVKAGALHCHDGANRSQLHHPGALCEGGCPSVSS